MEKSLAKLLVPEEILAHFDYEGWEVIGNMIRVHLVEKDDDAHRPKSQNPQEEWVLDGFMNPMELQTFPTLGKEVFLVLRRRRWKLKGGGKRHTNTYAFAPKGMKTTRAFGAFLKEIDRI